MSDVLIAGERTTHLGNWRQKPHSTWSFHHARELIPSANVCRGDTAVAPLERSVDDLRDVAFEGPDGATWRLAQMLPASETDALVVLHRGRLVFDWYAEHYDGREPHIVFSVSKSITGCLAGIVVDQGRLDPAAPVVRYLPEVAACGYGDCTVRHVLDMTVSLAFEESYLDSSGDYARYRAATLWNPPDPRCPELDLKRFLVGLARGPHAHGEIFEYKSPNSDLLGWMLERTAGVPYAELLSRCLWQPMGAATDAYVTLDRRGTARAAGGVCATPEDLARLGELMRLRGHALGRDVIPPAWVDDTLQRGDADAWQRGSFVQLAPHGRYRNQWYQSGNANGAFFAVGIHGQWIYVDPACEVVIVKLSSQAEPLSDPLDALALRAFAAIANAL